MAATPSLVVGRTPSEARAALVAEQAALQAALPVMPDAELVQRMADCERARWAATQARGMSMFAPGWVCDAAMQREYDGRAASRQMPPIPMPTDIPAYQKAVGQRQWDGWIESNLPEQLPWSPLRAYAQRLSWIRWGAQESPYGKLMNLGFLALPFAAGYWAHRRTGGSLAWTAASGVGSVYVVYMALSALSSMLPGRY